MNALLWQDDLSFLFSSQGTLPMPFFQGYAHVESDFVVGQRGADAYLEATGNHILPGEDGCYVTVTPSGQGALIGVDYAGLKKLFVWQRGRDWCVSNSLTRLRHHVCDVMGAGWLAPNRDQIAALRISGASATEQLSNHHTILEEVRLVPLNKMLHVTADGLREVPVQRRTGTGSYVEDLARFIDTWRARLLTLVVHQESHIATDLSGGLDSRVVFALAGSSTSGPLNDAMTFVSGKGPAQRADFEVATRIAHTFELELNRRPRASVSDYSHREAFAAWYELNVGVYMPLYQPKARLTPRSINLSGLGGENHRSFYPEVSSRDFVDSFRSVVGSSALAEPWRAATHSLLEHWASERSQISPLVRFYREFRGRIHGGMFAQTKINVMPLASQLMEPLAVAGRRVYFDAIANTMPGLLDIPFDRPEKAPTPGERRDLVRLTDRPEVMPGRVYASDESAPARGYGSSTFVDQVSELAERSANGPAGSARALFGDAWVNTALAKMHAARERGSISRPRELSDVTRLITAAWALEPYAASDLRITPNAVSDAAADR